MAYKCTKCRKRQAKYNWPTEIIALFCKLCMLDGMINVKSNKCIECDKVPNFNDEGQPAKYCKDHAKPGMVDVKHKRCKQEGCENRACYEGWCGDHKPEGAQDGHKKCPCGKHANFGNPLTMKPEFCSKCKPEGMINVKAKVCEHSECQKIASFGFNGQKQFCGPHKEKGMESNDKRRCLKCNKNPTFAKPGEKPEYCSEHKEEGMVDVVHKKCEFKDCDKQPTHNYPDQKKPVRCSSHAEKGMVSVKSKKCISCSKTAIFGKDEFSRPSVCQDHFIEGYINIFEERQCSKCVADYEVIINDVKYCFEHCPEKDYEAAIRRLCKYCDVHEDVSHICAACMRRRHKKEYAIVRHLRREIKIDFVHDEIIADQQCSRKRPDAYFDLPDRIIIVEIDERQHVDYNEICECSRMSEIVGAVGGREVTFIRYNPDTVRWNGKPFKPEQAERIDLLVNVIKDELVRGPTGFKVKLMQLWFDDSLEEYTPCKIEDITLGVAI